MEPAPTQLLKDHRHKVEDSRLKYGKLLWFFVSTERKGEREQRIVKIRETHKAILRCGRDCINTFKNIV